MTHQQDGDAAGEAQQVTVIHRAPRCDVQEAPKNRREMLSEIVSGIFQNASFSSKDMEYFDMIQFDVMGIDDETIEKRRELHKKKRRWISDK